MAVLHNSFSRGLNSIYLQAPYIKEEDVQDFIKYCLVWHSVVSTHHEQEEKLLFPAIEKAGGASEIGLMEENVKDHSKHCGSN
jgi:hemerythrin-like domain-containing protein